MIPHDVQKLINDIEFKGDFRSVIGSFDFNGRTPEKNKLNLKCDLNDVSMNVGVPVSDMTTNMTLDVSNFGQSDPAAKENPTTVRMPQIRLSLTSSSSEISGLKVSDLKLSLANSLKTPNIFTAPAIKGRIGPSGTLSANVKILQQEVDTYQVGVILDNVPLEDIAQNASGDLEEAAANKVSGVFSTRISVEARGKQPQQAAAQPLTGRGVFGFSGAQINQLPLLAAVGMSMARILNLDLAQLTEQRSISGSSEFIIHGKDITINPFVMNLPSMDVKGNGQMDWDTQQIALKLQAHPPQTQNVPSASVRSIVQAITDRLVSLEIKGPVGNPKTTFVTLGGIRKTWESIFKGQKGQ